MLVEELAVALRHIALRHLNRVAVVANNAAPGVGHERIVCSEITGQNAGIGLVAVFRFEAERVGSPVALRAIAAGIGVADELDHPLTPRHRQQLATIGQIECHDKGATIFALGALL